MGGQYRAYPFNNIRDMASALAAVEDEACMNRAYNNEYLAGRLGITVKELNSSLHFIENLAKVIAIACEAVDATYEKDYVDRFIRKPYNE